MVTMSASLASSGGKIPGSRRANIDLPEPGGPMNSRYEHPLRQFQPDVLADRGHRPCRQRRSCHRPRNRSRAASSFRPYGVSLQQLEFASVNSMRHAATTHELRAHTVATPPLDRRVHQPELSGTDLNDHQSQFSDECQIATTFGLQKFLGDRDQQRSPDPIRPPLRSPLELGCRRFGQLRPESKAARTRSRDSRHASSGASNDGEPGKPTNMNFHISGRPEPEQVATN